jgi:hypothetical protein
MSLALRHCALVALLVSAFGCGDSTTGPSQRVPLGQPFDLGVGESVVVEDELLLVSFDRVLSDSRCPLGVFCIQEGDAVVRVTPERLPNQVGVLTLHTQASLGDAGDFKGFRVRLVELAPHPIRDQTIAPGDYVATLEVTRP